MLTRHQWVAQAAQRLRAAGIESARLDARLLAQHALNLSAEMWAAAANEPFTATQSAQIEPLLQARLSRVPLAQIIGYRDFWKDRFVVSAEVLCPRPDSETLIEAALQAYACKVPPATILELGVGSGCLLLSLLKEWPEAYGVGVDISLAAIEIARRNSNELAVSQRCSFINAVWNNALQMKVDMLISNPPYIPASEIAALEPEVKNHEPFVALCGGEDGLNAYRQLATAIQQSLSPQGLAIVELGAGQASAVCAIMQAEGLQPVEVKPDLRGIGRACVIKKRM